MATTVVILGAGWAGLPLAHKLLKYTLPKLKTLKVILVSPNTHFYWNVAAVRGVIPDAIPDEQLFLPIEPGFARYPTENFEFLLGSANRLKPELNIVDVRSTNGMARSVSYDHLVIATGSQIRSNLPFKPVGTHEDTLAAFHALQKQIDGAQSIIVAGGGPTGVETAGELAAAYGGKKNVTLVIGGDHVLQAAQVLSSVSRIAENDLQKLNVKLVRNTQVKNSRTQPTEGSVTQTSLTLSDGSTLVADLYLPLFGVYVNTGFVPADLLDKGGNLNLNKTMQVVGTQNVWGIGDVGNMEAKQLTLTDAQIIYLSGALDSVLMGQHEKVKEYKPNPKKMIFVSMGKNHATGQIGGWRLWGWMVSYVKGRSLFVDTAVDYVDGKRLRHASM